MILHLFRGACIGAILGLGLAVYVDLNEDVGDYNLVQKFPGDIRIIKEEQISITQCLLHRQNYDHSWCEEWYLNLVYNNRIDLDCGGFSLGPCKLVYRFISSPSAGRGRQDFRGPLGKPRPNNQGLYNGL